MKQSFTHVALSVPREQFQNQFISDIRLFYNEVFGWTEIKDLAIENERLILRIFGDGSEQYLNIRARDEPMTTSGYEHLGFAVSHREDFEQLHLLCRDYAKKDVRVQVSEVKRGGEDGRYFSFRVDYLLPLCIEVQYWANDGG